MATTITRTVAASGGDYTSLSAWEAAEQGDLVALDEIHEAEVQVGLTDTSAVTIDGSVTDATRYLRVFPGAGAEARMPWNAAGYQLATGLNTLAVIDPYTRIE